ncbi:MAG: hypothetical protein GF334_12850 [Candidatus Altiarchaeales archaeon]|nr:hypothetical protein [Candidatus Altiarchaeales archaeon]
MRENLLGKEVFFMRFALSKGPLRVMVCSFDWKWVFVILRKEDVGRRNRNLAVRWKDLELTEEAAHRRVLRWARKKEKYHLRSLEALQRISEESRKALGENK